MGQIVDKEREMNTIKTERNVATDKKTKMEDQCLTLMQDMEKRIIAVETELAEVKKVNIGLEKEILELKNVNAEMQKNISDLKNRHV